jgi:hypothetical protein
MSFLNNIPHNRQLLYLLLIGALPIVLVATYLLFKNSEVNTIQENIDLAKQQALLREKKQAGNMAIREHYKDADRFYIDKQLESLTLLEPETEVLQKITNQSNLIVDENVKKRLEFLIQDNHFVFSEGAVQTYPFFRETQEALVHPVEIDTNDLQKILARIEGTNIGTYAPGPNRPQLLITDFKLDKKNVHEKNEVFVLDIKLIKREFF